MQSSKPCRRHRHRRAGDGLKRRVAILAVLFLLPFALAASSVRAQTPLTPPLPDLTGIVTDTRWAIVLGKALFWDERVGSDGNACASCHFHAGADTRLTNQLNPGFNDITKGPNGDDQFGSERSDTGTVRLGDMPSGAPAGANYTLTPADLPLHQLVDETNRNSAIITTTNDRVSSQGAFAALFTNVPGQSGTEHCGDTSGAIFHTQSGDAARQVEPRNTPTVINAVFNHRNFWDGRANNLFNGVGVFGMRDIAGDPNKRLIILDANGQPQLGYLQLEHASLASQAVAPLLSVLEMSCDGRTFADLGQKVLTPGQRPLQSQTIHPHDSVLAPYAQPNGKGLRPQYNYITLIEHAFDAKYWAATEAYRMVNGQLINDPTGYTQMEINFPMFWGLAIMLYESTLISNQSEFDTLVAGNHLTFPNRFGCTADATVDPLLARGCAMFFGIPGAPIPGGGTGVGCAFCHGGRDTFSAAAVQAGRPFTPFLNPVPDVNGVNDLRDLGFANLGLRPVFSDQMSGRTDAYGNPLSFGRQYKAYLESGDPTKLLDPFLQQAVAAGTVPAQGLGAGHWVKLEVDGASKIPTLRNVALTPPYFSWGGYASLRQVLKVYNRGMNRRTITSTNHYADAHGSACTSGDESGSGPDGDHPWPVTDPDCNTNTTGLIQPLGLLDCDANDQTNPTCVAQHQDTTSDDLAALVRFLTSLTDPRVQCDQAPFDHPSLDLVAGEVDQATHHDGQAVDIVFTLPAVGATGYDPASGFCIPNAGALFAPGMQARSGGPRVPLQQRP
jgi:cytochrome c peroxidase